MTDADRLRLARRIYSREGFLKEYRERLGDGRTAAAIYYELEEIHDDLFGCFKFPTLNAFAVWKSKRKRDRNRAGRTVRP
jgi:hypothetical protein